MKKVILLFSLIISILFIACSKSSSDTAKQLTPEPIFTQEEVDIFNTEVVKLNGIKDYSIISTKSSLKLTGLTDAFGLKNLSIVFEVTKDNGYYKKNIKLSNGEKSSTLTYWFLSINNLFDIFDSTQTFNKEELSAISSFIKPLVTSVSGTNLHIYFSSLSGESFQGEIYLDIEKRNSLITSIELYRPKFVKDKNFYYYIDSQGFVVKDSNLVNLLNSNIIKNKIEKIISENKLLEEQIPHFTTTEKNYVENYIKSLKNSLGTSFISDTISDFELSWIIKNSQGIEEKFEIIRNDYSDLSMKKSQKESNSFVLKETIQELSIPRLLGEFLPEDNFVESEIKKVDEYIKTLSLKSDYTLKYSILVDKPYYINVSLMKNDTLVHTWKITKNYSKYIILNTSSINSILTLDETLSSLKNLINSKTTY